MCYLRCKRTKEKAYPKHSINRIVTKLLPLVLLCLFQERSGRAKRFQRTAMSNVKSGMYVTAFSAFIQEIKWFLSQPASTCVGKMVFAEGNGDSEPIWTAKLVWHLTRLIVMGGLSVHVSQSRSISQTPLWQDNPRDKQQQPTDGKNSSVSLHSMWSLYWEKQQSCLKAFQDFLCSLTKTLVMKIAIKVKFEADWQVVAKIGRQSARESVTNCKVCLWCFSCSQENGLVVM